MGDRGPSFLTHTEQDALRQIKGKHMDIFAVTAPHDDTYGNAFGHHREKPSKYIVELNAKFTGRSNTCRRRHEHKLESTNNHWEKSMGLCENKVPPKSVPNLVYQTISIICPSFFS